MLADVHPVRTERGERAGPLGIGLAVEGDGDIGVLAPQANLGVEFILAAVLNRERPLLFRFFRARVKFAQNKYESSKDFMSTFNNSFDAFRILLYSVDRMKSSYSRG